MFFGVAASIKLETGCFVQLIAAAAAQIDKKFHFVVEVSLRLRLAGGGGG